VNVNWISTFALEPITSNFNNGVTTSFRMKDLDRRGGKLATTIALNYVEQRLGDDGPYAEAYVFEVELSNGFTVLINWPALDKVTDVLSILYVVSAVNATAQATVNLMLVEGE
jgi:hypothetical protein